MAAPFEIMAAPYDVYVAPVGTVFPDVSQTPAGAWLLLGSSGNKNMDEDGVTVTHGQTIEVWRPLGLTAARKAFRTEETLAIEFAIADMSATQLARVLNQAIVTNTAAATNVGGQLSVPLLQGMEVKLYAMICRATGDSAGGSGFNTQYQVPMVYQNAEVAPVHKKGEPALLEMEWQALWDSSLGFGRYVSQNAAAL